MKKSFSMYEYEGKNERKERKGVKLVRGVFFTGLIAFSVYKIVRPNFVSMDASNKVTMEYDGDMSTLTRFEKGTHIISVPLKSSINLYDYYQYPYYDGYRCIGVEKSAGNRRYAIYINDEPVMCEINGLNSEGEEVYNSIGTPEKASHIDEDLSDGYTFKPYEHTISVPVSDPSYDITQYDSFDGYELVDVITHAIISVGINNHEGSVAIYTNTVPVRCKNAEYNDELNTYECLEFGTPLEKEKVKTLS